MFPSRSGDTLAERHGHLDRSRLRIGNLPKPVLCIPLLAQWLWLAVCYRSLTLPSSLNPGIETGGLAGESKAACLAQIGPSFAHYVAAWSLISPGEDVIERRLALGWHYPLIAKPDIGWCGYGVRRIEGDAALAAYAADFPRKASFILQQFAADPNEAGLSYVRKPGASAGRVTAMTFRHAPSVVGDGRSSLAELALVQCAAAQRATGTTQGAQVPAAGARVALTTVASIRVGARYEDASAQVSAPLQARIDAIARSMPNSTSGGSMSALPQWLTCRLDGLSSWR